MTGYWLPSFLFASAVLVALMIETYRKWSLSWAKPALVVYATVAAWYLGDYVYSGADIFEAQFESGTLNLAFFQVAGFAIAFRIFVAWLCPEFLRDLPPPKCELIFEQREIELLFRAVVMLWAVLHLIGLMVCNWQWLAIVWPLSSPEKVGMFVHPGVGDSTSFLTASAGYIYQLVCSLFGVFLVVFENKRLKRICLGLMIYSWPYFLFDRTRNIMLALILPGVVAFLLFTGSKWLKKAGVSILIFAAINLWFHVVMIYRGSYEMEAFREAFESKEDRENHLGLDMLSELCWIDTFIASGHYEINYGRSYWEQIANVVPRAFWANKPMVSIDYAVARGFGGSEYGAGVYATVAPGMIGGGLLNFGRFFGVLSGALLMAGWASLLARFWRQRQSIARAGLFMLGIGLTFNLGRDITLLVLWPFLFAYFGVRIWEKYYLKKGQHRRKKRPARRVSNGASPPTPVAPL